MPGVETIYEAVERFRGTRGIMDFLRIPRLIIRQKRCIEVLYGACTMLTASPAVPCSTGETDFGDPLRTTWVRFVRENTQRLDNSRLAVHAVGGEAFNHRFHCFTRTPHGFVVGEYGEGRPRLLIMHEKQVTVLHPYDSDPGVRHIHAVQYFDGGILVATGDSNKYLDRFEFEDGTLRFRKRIMRHLGGFTSACVLQGDCWLGTDFTGRPNYLLNLRTRRKYMFPRPAFTQFCDLLLPMDHASLLCLNRDLRGNRSFSIFDVERGQFLYCVAAGKEALT